MEDKQIFGQETNLEEKAIHELLSQIVGKHENSLIEQLMVQIGQYYRADRSYIFEVSDDKKYVSNTYEWCADGVRPEIDNLRQVPIEVTEPWMIEFRKNGCFYISCDDQYAKEQPIVYEVLVPQNISSLLAAPIVLDGGIVGFLGVDNPKANRTHKLFLSVAASVIYHEVRVIKEREKEARYRQMLQKVGEAAEAANRAKTTFLFNMSHDIRTPMNAIVGYTQLIAKNRDDREKCDDYLRKINSSCDFLLSLINNVLEMARIESGRSKLEEEALDAAALCREIADVYTELMRDKQITFTTEIDLKTPYICCDKVKINQIYLNLLSNAYKYTPKGGRVDMIVRELPSDKAGFVNIQTVVADTGIGMSADYLPKLFEDFSREHTETETKIQGTGLGMPIVKKLIDLMDGAIAVESAPGRGTTFTLTLPHRIAEPPRAQMSEKAADVEADFAGKRILLAEDNELNAEIAMEILSDAGFEVDNAEDGMVCLDMLQRAPCGYYDLILMDIQMPNMNGYEATRAIRAMEDPGRSQIPILAMTANAFEEDRQDAFNAGMNGHLAKPIDIAQMMAALAEILG